MALSRRSFLKRLGGSLAAFGIGAKVIEAVPETAAELEALEGFSQIIDPFTTRFTQGDYLPGMIYYNVDGTWRLATFEGWDGVIGVAVSPTEIVTEGIVTISTTTSGSYWVHRT